MFDFPLSNQSQTPLNGTSIYLRTLLEIFMTFFPVNVRKFTLDISEYEKVTLVTLRGGWGSKSDIK